MKYILLLSAILLSSLGYGQGIYQKAFTNNIWNRAKADSVLIVPRDTLPTNNALYNGAPVGDSGRIAWIGGFLWVKGASGPWKKVGDIPDLTPYMKYVDTAAMLAAYLRAADTVYLSNSLSVVQDSIAAQNLQRVTNKGYTTTNPLESSSRITVNNGTVSTTLDIVSTSGVVGTNTNHDLLLRTNNTTRGIVTNDGSFLWGPITPDGSRIFQVGGNMRGSGGSHRFGDNGLSGMEIENVCATGTWSIGTNNGGNGTSNNQWAVRDSAAAVNRLTLQRGTGNAGIGTDAPTDKLVVRQDASTATFATVVNFQNNAAAMSGLKLSTFNGDWYWQAKRNGGSSFSTPSVTDATNIDNSGNWGFSVAASTTNRVDIKGSSTTTGNALLVENSAGTAILTAANNGEVTVNGVKYVNGTGSPEGVVTAPIGSVYTNKSGGAGTTLYIKESGVGNTGWIAK